MGVLRLTDTKSCSYNSNCPLKCANYTTLIVGTYILYHALHAQNILTSNITKSCINVIAAIVAVFEYSN